jgi:hypothetical protein
MPLARLLLPNGEREIDLLIGDEGRDAQIELSPGTAECSEVG